MIFLSLLQETERANFHELLEVETIEASKLRHRLKFLPGQIKDEIQGIRPKSSIML